MSERSEELRLKAHRYMSAPEDDRPPFEQAFKEDEREYAERYMQARKMVVKLKDTGELDQAIQDLLGGIAEKHGSRA